MKRDIINEILEIKRRRSEENSLNKIEGKILTLIDQIENYDNYKELINYFPVAIAASYEAYFTDAIKRLVDKGEPYSTNIVKFEATKKIDARIVNSLIGKKITIGDLLSHVLSYSNINQIISNLNLINSTDNKSYNILHQLDCYIEDRISKQVGFMPIELPPPLQIFSDMAKDKDLAIRYYKQNKVEIYKSIRKLFEIRHQFCHEFKNSYSRNEILRISKDSMILLRVFIVFVNEVILEVKELTNEYINSEIKIKEKEYNHLIQKMKAKFFILDISSSYSGINELLSKLVEYTNKYYEIRDQYFSDLKDDLKEHLLWNLILISDKVSFLENSLVAIDKSILNSLQKPMHEEEE